MRGSKNQVASGSESMATECVTIPGFTGADLRSWISWLEKFFVREDFTDDDDKPLGTDDLEIESLGYQRSSQICDNQESLVKNTKLPVFDGFMSYGWIFRVERVFRAVQYSEAAKLDLVYASLEGDGLDWYTEEVTNGEFRDWSNFKMRFLAHFAPKTCGSQSESKSVQGTVSHL